MCACFLCSGIAFGPCVDAQVQKKSEVDTAAHSGVVAALWDWGADLAACLGGPKDELWAIAMELLPCVMGEH